MIVSDSFRRSAAARDIEFTTNNEDRPLIVQFAAKNASQFADASSIVIPYADGIDLNCGCPQRWAMQDGYGACLLNKPDLLANMIQETKEKVAAFTPHPFSVSIKIRIHDDVRQTVELCQRAVCAGASWITVHGRTKEQRGQPVNLEAIRLIRESVSVPVIANGDIRSLSDAEMVRGETGVHGVMAARGILSNPAMFAGCKNTPRQCISDWVGIAMQLGVSFQAFHRHLMFMMEDVTSKPEKRLFNGLGSTTAVLDYLAENYGIDCSDLTILRETEVALNNVKVK